MRALCGAIIAAGALIGLGLAGIGIGVRYTREQNLEDTARPYIVLFSRMDTPLVFLVVFLTTVALVGLGITLIGLAYHHHRREREHALEIEKARLPVRTTV